MVRPKRDIKPPTNLREFVVTSEVERDFEDLVRESNDTAEKESTDAEASGLDMKSKKTIGLRCKQCDKKFSSYLLYSRHVKSHKGKTFLCEDCGKCLSSLRSLNEHLDIHKECKQFSCKICGHESRHGSVHSRHMTVHSTKLTQRFKCSICSQYFKQNEYLKQHLRKHKGDKPYACALCPKTFSVKTELNRHTSSHSDKRPHSCSYCDKRFKMRHNLAAHVKRHTSRIPLWKCKHCKTTFSSQRLLETHMKTHSESIVFLELFKKDSRTIMVMTSSGDRRRLPSYQPIILPDHLSLDDPHSLMDCELSLSVNEVLIPISMVSKSFGTGDFIRMKIIDKFDSPSEPLQEQKGSDIKISLVGEVAKTQVFDEEPNVNDAHGEEEAFSSCASKIDFEELPSLKEFLDLASGIVASSLEGDDLHQKLPLINYLANVSKALPQPLISEVCIQMHGIIAKLQKFLIKWLPRKETPESTVKNSSALKSRSGDFNSTKVETDLNVQREKLAKNLKETDLSTDSFDKQELQIMHRSYLTFSEILHNHFALLLKDR